jgi:hypothetical protein
MILRTGPRSLPELVLSAGRYWRLVPYAVLGVALAVAGDVFMAETDLVEGVSSAEALDVELLVDRPTSFAAIMGIVPVVGVLLILIHALVRPEIDVRVRRSKESLLSMDTFLGASPVPRSVAKRGPPPVR